MEDNMLLLYHAEPGPLQDARTWNKERKCLPSVIRTGNVYIKEGESLNITCKYEPGDPPETAEQWKKEGILLVYSNKTLLYQRVARTDAGNYTCIATNTYDNGHTNFMGVDSHRFILHVLYQPIVQRFSLEQFDDNLNVTVSENESVVFNCVAEGFPSPDMRLLKDSAEYGTIYVCGFKYHWIRRKVDVFECIFSS
ncbi:hypothetical protein DPMN_029390 [Dreissena polymorpha]|uniref:Ig-like domain-containing protein n=1 Tax=Dreissena polymorpha TaxID=45954 RepID=A0A9D4LZ23_DREPO|nr:hypothetical protein DPMN_029390 [Dreissena polymorpha]